MISQVPFVASQRVSEFWVCESICVKKKLIVYVNKLCRDFGAIFHQNFYKHRFYFARNCHRNAAYVNIERSPKSG